MYTPPCTMQSPHRQRSKLRHDGVKRSGQRHRVRLFPITESPGQVARSSMRNGGMRRRTRTLEPLLVSLASFWLDANRILLSGNDSVRQKMIPLCFWAWRLAVYNPLSLTLLRYPYPALAIFLSLQPDCHFPLCLFACFFSARVSETDTPCKC